MVAVEKKTNLNIEVIINVMGLNSRSKTVLDWVGEKNTETFKIKVGKR